MRELQQGQYRSNGRAKHREKYAAYMRSGAWFRRRALWAETQQKLSGSITCLLCGAGWDVKKDDLHHATYKNLGAEAHKDLWALCRKCHSEVHRLLRNRQFYRGGSYYTANIQVLKSLRAKRKILGQ